MKAARRASTLVLVLFVLGVTALAQDHTGGTLAERQKAPTVLGGTGLFNTFSTRTLCKGEFNFALFWNNFDRDPGDLDINQVPFNFTVGLTNRWELWVNWVTWQQVTSRRPFLLSGYQYSASALFGDPFRLLGPASGGTEGGAAFFPGGGADFGGILPKLGAFGTPIGFTGAGVFSPGGPNAPVAVGLGPAFQTPLPGFYNDLPFFGEVDFLGFDGQGRPVFGPRMSSNGSGDVYVGTKFSIIDPNKHWFSMALGGYIKIPVDRDDHARSRGRTNGEFEGGPILMFGQESGGKRFRLYENIGYIKTGDPEENDLKVLDLSNKLLFNVGMSIAINKHAEFITELLHTRYVGGRTPSLIENDPWELNLGLRFFFKDGAISFGGGYRRLLNGEDDITLPVARLVGFNPPFFRVPTFDFPNQSFGREGGKDGFVGYISIGGRKSCPPPPAPTCVLSASTATLNKGERLTLSSRPSTPGYADDKVSYEYRWEVKDAQGRPVSVSGSGASVEVPTGQLACGSYSVTTTVSASVSAVDCPSDCLTTGQTTCTTTFEITEPPCPSVSCDVTGSPRQVLPGERVTFRATGSGGGNLSYSWSASAGRLSSTTGTEVTLDTTGVSPDSTVTVTVNVATDRSRCDQPCPGGSCSTSIAVGRPVEEVRPPEPTIPCGPIFFPFNSARINNEHKACLDEIALRLQQDPRASVVIDGHRDSSERVGISVTRINNARAYLVTEKGIDSARITLRNYGDTCAHESGDPNLNRRVEFFILPDGAQMSALDTMKRCASGSSPQVITTEEPAQSVDRPRPTRRAPRRRPRRPGEPILMMVIPTPATTSQL